MVSTSGRKLVNAPLFTLQGESPFAIAAFWDQGDVVDRCYLLTTCANAVLEPIHDRMPVIIRSEDWDEWLCTGEIEEQSIARITTPYLTQEMNALAVSPLVNSARFDDARMLRAGPAAGLFRFIFSDARG